MGYLGRGQEREMEPSVEHCLSMKRAGIDLQVPGLTTNGKMSHLFFMCHGFLKYCFHNQGVLVPADD